MEAPFRLLQPFLGARIMKTALAVFLSLVVFTWFGVGYASFAAVAAVLAVQPSIHQAREVFRQQFLGNLVAGAIATLLGLFLPVNPLTMALGCVLVLGTLNLLRLTEAAGLAVVVLLFVMERPQHDYLLYTAARLGTITVGMAIGALVNRFVHPPDVVGRARQEIRSGLERVDQFIHHLAGCLADPEAYRKEEIKREARSAQRHMERARALLELGTTQPEPPELHLLKRANGSMFVFVEAIMNLHKIALMAGGLTVYEDREAVAAALRTLQAYMRGVMQAVLEGTRPDPDAADQFRQALAALEARTEQLIDRRDTRARGLHLHGILGEISHMGWRMDSLVRLL